MKTRFIGKCGVCEGDFKLHEDKLVHHGFKRPGDGMIHGDCFAVQQAPYELSSKPSQLYKTYLASVRVQPAERLAKLQSGTVESLLVEKHLNGYNQPPTLVAVKKAEKPYDFERALSSAIFECEAKIRHLDREIERMDKLIEGWVLKPVRTIEEEEAKITADKDARKAAKAAALQAKVEKKVAFYQGRIDSALKKKKADSLMDLFESVLRASSDLKLTRQEMLDLVDRKPVWDLFGLVCPASWNDQVNRDALQKMWMTGYWPN